MLAIPPLDPATLMARVRDGDRAAFDLLARRLLPRAHRIAARVLGAGPDAEDAVQAALVNLWRKAAAYDPGRGALDPWFNRLVANACLDRRRTIRPVAPLEAAAHVAATGPSPFEAAETGETARRVDAALARLNPRQRAVIALFHGEGLSMAEVADAIDATPKAVEGLLARARGELARMLGDMRNA